MGSSVRSSCCKAIFHFHRLREELSTAYTGWQKTQDATSEKQQPATKRRSEGAGAGGGGGGSKKPRNRSLLELIQEMGSPMLSIDCKAATTNRPPVLASDVPQNEMEPLVVSGINLDSLTTSPLIKKSIDEFAREFKGSDLRAKAGRAQRRCVDAMSDDILGSGAAVAVAAETAANDFVLNVLAAHLPKGAIFAAALPEEPGTRRGHGSRRPASAGGDGGTGWGD